MDKIGERIRGRREQLAIQVNDLANAVGVTASLISQIERAKAFPSIVTLKKIAIALQTSVGSLIGENESFERNPVLKFSEKKFVQANEQGVSLFLLSLHDPQKMIEPHLLVFPPGTTSEKLILPMPGQSFYFALRGNFIIRMGAQDYSLDAQDSFFYHSGLPHVILNHSPEESMLLWISTNPVL